MTQSEQRTYNPTLDQAQYGNWTQIQGKSPRETQKPSPLVEVSQNNEIKALPIDSTFPVEPEVQFHRTNRELPPGHPDALTPEQVRYYQTENMVTFLCEFAGKVPYKKLAGILTENGQMRICNMDILAMAENSARIAGDGSREQQELLGLYRMQAAIGNGANRIDIVSPPKVGDYMLIFSFQIGKYYPGIGYELHEIVSNLPEDMRSLETSAQVHYQLASAGSVFDPALKLQSAGDYISNPIAYRTDDPFSLAKSVEAIGISQKDIAYSEEFELRVRTLLRSDIEQYLDMVQQLSHMPAPDSVNRSDDYRLLQKQIEAKRDEIFSFSKAIAKELRAETTKTTSVDRSTPTMSVADVLDQRTHNPLLFAAMAKQIMDRNPAQITGGTSCPSLAGRTGSGFMQAFANAGFSPEGMFHQMQNMQMKEKISIRCPTCKCKETYNLRDVQRAGALKCRGTTKDGVKCTNVATCWEPFFATKNQSTVALAA